MSWETNINLDFSKGSFGAKPSGAFGNKPAPKHKTGMFPERVYDIAKATRNKDEWCETDHDEV